MVPPRSHGSLPPGGASVGSGAAQRRLAMRWLIVFVLAFLLFSGLRTWLQRIGLGRLPGDFTVRIAGREIYLPFTSSVVLSAIAAGVSWLL